MVPTLYLKFVGPIHQPKLCMTLFFLAFAVRTYSESHSNSGNIIVFLVQTFSLYPQKVPTSCSI